MHPTALLLAALAALAARSDLATVLTKLVLLGALTTGKSVHRVNQV